MAKQIPRNGQSAGKHDEIEFQLYSCNKYANRELFCPIDALPFYKSNKTLRLKHLASYPAAMQGYRKALTFKKMGGQSSQYQENYRNMIILTKTNFIEILKQPRVADDYISSHGNFCQNF